MLEIVHYFKTGMKESRKKVRVKKSKDPDLRNIAVETGIKDLAEHHDHYLYSVSK